jgi:hypothetical protein
VLCRGQQLKLKVTMTQKMLLQNRKEKKKNKFPMMEERARGQLRTRSKQIVQ